MLGPRDRRHLDGAHPDLKRVVERAAREGAVPFLVGDPTARTGSPRHLAGLAIDLYPLLGRPVTALRRIEFLHLVAALRSAARAEGVAMIHGADRGEDAARHGLDPTVYPS